MARKRKPEEGLPTSPLAAKLASQVTQHRISSHSSIQKEAEPIRATDKFVVKKEKQVKIQLPNKARRTHKRKESRVLMDSEEWALKDEILFAIRKSTGEQVEFSHLMRALLSLAGAAIPSISANAVHASLPSRPANNDTMAMASFEDELSKFLLLSLRDKKAMDFD